jgi:RNA polymerase sigma-70 factor (ECF subfamily)
MPLAMEHALKDDGCLVQETLAGDQLAYQKLVERYQDRIFGIVRHYTRNAVEIEDIVQDSFIKAYHKLDTFQNQGSFSTWLYRIAINTTLDFLKRVGRSPVQAVDDPEEHGRRPTAQRNVHSPSARMEREEIARITQRVLAELPEIFRTVLVLREFEERSYQEMADCLGISIGTVESRLFRARARFKEALCRLHPEYGVE